jgi:hypothetical protein
VPLAESLATVKITETWLVAPVVLSEHICVTVQPDCEVVHEGPPSVPLVVEVMKALRLDALSLPVIGTDSSIRVGHPALDPLCRTLCEV